MLRQAAARALGSLRAEDAVTPLVEALKDSDRKVGLWTIWALGELRHQKALQPLAALLLEKKTEPRCFEALRKYEEPEARRLLVLTLIGGARDERQFERRMEAELMLSQLREDPLALRLTAISDPALAVRESAFRKEKGTGCFSCFSAKAGKAACPLFRVIEF